MRGLSWRQRNYDLTPLAVSRLIETAGEVALVSYWEAIGRGTEWTAAFTAAFGRAIQAFYAGFESYRHGLRLDPVTTPQL